MTELEIYKSGLEDGAKNMATYVLELITDGMSQERLSIFLEKEIQLHEDHKQNEALKKG